MLRITAIYIYKDREIEISVLTLKVLEGAYNSDNIAKYVIEVITR